MKIDLSNKTSNDEVFSSRSACYVPIVLKHDDKITMSGNQTCYLDGVWYGKTPQFFNSAQECANYFAWIAKQEKLVNADEAIKAFRAGKKIKRYGSDIDIDINSYPLNNFVISDIVDIYDSLLAGADKYKWEILD